MCKCVKVYQVLHIYLPICLTTTLYVKYCYSHFTDEEAKAQKDLVLS